MMAKFFQNTPDKKKLPNAVDFLMETDSKHHWGSPVSMPDLNSD